MTEYRAIWLQLEKLPDAQWRELRDLARVSALFANGMITEMFITDSVTRAGAKEAAVALRETYALYADKLSSDVRDGINTEVKGSWQRHKGEVRAGLSSLPLFRADRALVMRGDKSALIEQRDDDYALSVRLLPVPAPKHSFRLDKNAYKKSERFSCLEKLVSGEYPIVRVSFSFERPGRKVFAIITYKREFEDGSEGIPSLACGRIGPISERRELYIRTESRTLALSDYVHRILEMKERYAAIQERMRITAGRTKWRKGRARKLWKYRRLMQTQSFSDWAKGPLGQMAAEIVGFCAQNKVGELSWEFDGSGFPEARLRFEVAYRAKVKGMDVVDGKPLTEEAGKGREKWAIQQKKAIRELKKAGKAALQS